MSLYKFFKIFLLEIEPKVSLMLGKCSTTELNPQILNYLTVEENQDVDKDSTGNLI